MPGALTLTKSISCTVRNPLPPSPTSTPSLSLHSSSHLSNFRFIALPRTLLPISVQRRSGKKITVQARLFHYRQHLTEIKAAMFLVASGKLLHSLHFHHSLRLYITGGVCVLRNERQPRNNGVENIRRLNHLLVKDNEQRRFVVGAQQPATKSEAEINARRGRVIEIIFHWSSEPDHVRIT